MFASEHTDIIIIERIIPHPVVIEPDIPLIPLTGHDDVRGDVFNFYCGKSLKRLGIQVPDNGDMLSDFCCADMKASGDGADVSEGSASR